MEPYAAKVTDRVQNETCPRCGSYKLVALDDCTQMQAFLCIGCGYFKVVKQSVICDEGVAFLVRCVQCQRCETWIRYPLKLYREDEELRRLLLWTCDLCGHRMRVSDSILDPTKKENWYKQKLSAKIVKK